MKAEMDQKRKVEKSAREPAAAEYFATPAKSLDHISQRALQLPCSVSETACAANVSEAVGSKFEAS
jgi:hypothetical protein